MGYCCCGCAGGDYLSQCVISPVGCTQSLGDSGDTLLLTPVIRLSGVFFSLQ